MNRFNLLKKNEGLIYLFVKNGILSYQIIRDMEIYSTYHNLDETIKELKYIELGELYELSPKRIEQIIYQMERKIN